MKRTTVMLFVLAGLVGLPAVAAAQDSDIEKAQAHFDQGGKYYFDGKYSEALVEFTKGYALADNPVFLYNIALCHWRMGDYDRAATTAEEAIEQGGLPADIDAKVKGRHHAFVGHSAATRVVSRVAAAREVAQGEPAPSEEPSAAAIEKAREKESNALLWTGVAVTAIGAGALAGFGVIEVGLSEDIRRFKDAADQGNRETAEALADEINYRATIGRVMLYSGAGLAATGLALIIVDLASSDGGDDRPTVGLVPTPDGVTAQMAIRF